MFVRIFAGVRSSLYGAPNDSGVLEIKDVQTLPSKFNDDRVGLLSVAKCRPMIVVSRNVRYVWIFVGVPLAGAPNDSGVV